LSLFQALRYTDKENELDIKIYESAKKITDIGGGIAFSPRALQIMRLIGLGDQIATILPEDDPDALSECPFDFLFFFSFKNKFQLLLW
jgi:hypothetical protein